MKKFYLVLLVCFSGIVFSYKADAQSSETPGQELLIEIPTLDSSRALPPLKAALIALGGVEYVDFCNSAKLLMLRVDRKIQFNDKNIENIISGSGFSVYYIKNDGTIDQVKQNCKDR